jgi:hypothetical protein
MSRGPAVVMAFVVAGALGTTFMGRWDAFSVGFACLFWGGLAAAITWIAGRRGKVDDSDDLPKFVPDTGLPVDYPQFNPATGLPVQGGTDAAGNTYGTTDVFDAIATVHHPGPGAR